MKSTNGTKLRSWVGMLLPPLAWSATLEAVYLTNGYHCLGSNVVWSHISSAIGFALCIAGGLISWSVGAQGGATGRTSSPGRFMRSLGVALAVLFAVLTLAQWLPLIYGVPCNK